MNPPEPRDLILRDIFTLGVKVVRRPVIRGDSALGTTPQPEPLAGIHAATTLRHAASRAVAECARYAREDGKTWTEIGAAMEPAHGEDSAFLAVASQMGRGPTFAWPCPACGQTVIDYGPEAGSPEDQETGHGQGCTRLAAVIAAWNAQWEDDTDGD